MKKSFAILFALMMLTLAGCQSESEPGERPPRITPPPAASQPAETKPAETEPAQVSDHVVDYRVDIPQSFGSTEMEGVVACWYNAEDGSNINVNVVDKDASFDESFSQIDASVMKEALNAAFQQAYGSLPTITDKEFIHCEVSGLPAYRYSYTIELNGMTMAQIIVCVNADRAYTFTYTDATADGAWMETFEDSAENIQMITE